MLAMTYPARVLRLLLIIPLAIVVPAGAAAPGWAGSTDEVTIVLVGDVGLNRSNQPVEAKGARRGGFLAWEETTSGIAEDINGDLNFMNVETVVTDRNDLPRDTKGQGGPFNFRTHPNGLRHLVSRGFNLLSLANNHSMDYGLPGLKETLKHVGALENERLAVAAGIGMNRDEAATPRRVNVKGTDIAFAAIGIVTNNLARHRAGPNQPGQIAYRFDDDFAEVRKRLTSAPAGYRILSIHYGTEGQVRTDARQIRRVAAPSGVEGRHRPHRRPSCACGARHRDRGLLADLLRPGKFPAPRHRRHDLERDLP